MLGAAMSPSAAHLTVAAISLIALRAGGTARNEAPAPIVPAPPVAQEIESPAASAPSPAPIPEVPQWTEGPDIGTGVAMKDTGNPRGQSAFIGYAGYSVSIEDAETWVDALYDSWLRD